MTWNPDAIVKTPGPAKLYEGLDLSLEEDRAIFRIRVVDYFKMTKAVNVMLACQIITGQRPLQGRDRAVRSIADFWIADDLAVRAEADAEQSRAAIERACRP